MSRPILSLKKEIEQTGEEKLLKNNDRQKEERDKQYLLAKEWIFSTWPKAFDYSNVVPLAINTRKEIAAEHERSGGSIVLGFGKNLAVSRVLRYWTSRFDYIKALTFPDAMRFDLANNQIMPVSGEHQKAASKCLNRLNKKNKNM